MKTPPAKLPNRDLAKLFFALRDLNGVTKAVFDPKTGRDISIKEPYGLSAQVTMQIVQNMSELKRRLDEYNVAVERYDSIAPDYMKKVSELLDVEVPVSLTIIPYASLRIGEKVGENRIQPGVIIDLLDLIDMPPT